MSVNFAQDGIKLQNWDAGLLSENGWQPEYGDTPHNRAIIRYVATLSDVEQVELANREDLKPLFNNENIWAVKYMAELAMREINNQTAFENLKVKTLDGKKPSKQTLRWPSDALDQSTDYVFFQFGKYLPPFSRDAADLRNKIGVEDGSIDPDGSSNVKKELLKNTTTSATYEMYSSSAYNLSTQGRMDIMLPIPQDLSNEIQQQWQGKQFTATGRAATAALAAGNWSYASNVVKNISGSSTALANALQTSVLNAIPGVGGSLSFNDVSGSTKGIVINPNAELLYDSPEMRELGMIFKMVPRNASEAATIRRICSAFRKASLPSWGAVGDVSMFKDDKFSPKKKEAPTVDISKESNWIRVPNLCKFTFMHGSVPHPYIYQFKPCAIQTVEVNYTPDGTFATYEDGAPVAVELRLNFMETKLIFANEVNIDPGVSV